MSTRQTPDILFVLGQHRITGGQRLQYQIDHFETTAMHALDDVLHCRDCASDQVHLDFKPARIHADRFLDAILAIDDELLHQRVQNLVIGRDRRGVGRLDGTLDIVLRDLLVRTTAMPLESLLLMWLPAMPV
jgi:hypothetical protein